jgi:photosystem II stability/assembly factor-like uncharacterized protein
MSIRCTIAVLMIVSLASAGHAQEIAWRPFGSLHYATPTAMAVIANGKLFLATGGDYSQNSALFYSTDNASTWHLSWVLPYQVSIISLATIGDSILLAALSENESYYYSTHPYTGLWRSTNAGASWEKTRDRPIKNVLAIPQTHLVFATIYDSLFVSRDLGQTWNPILIPPKYQYERYRVCGDDLVYISDSSLWFLRGLSGWQERLPPARPNDIWSVNGTLLLSASDSLYRSSDDGLTWTTLPTNQRVGAPVAMFKNGTMIAGIGYGELNRSTDFGRTWSAMRGEFYTSSGGELTLQYDSSGYAYFGNGHDLIRVRDTSEWTDRCSPSNIGIASIVASPTGVVFFGGENITMDGGANWRRMWRAQWMRYYPRYGFIGEGQDGLGYALLHSNDGIAWGQTEHIPGYNEAPQFLGIDRDGAVYALRNNNLSITSDIGHTWNTKPTTLRVNYGYGELAQTPNGYCFLGDSGGVYRSSNRGATWEFLSSNTLAGFVHCVASDSTGSLMACVPTQGVFCSLDDGLSWAPVTAGLTDDSLLNAIAYSTSGYWLLATGSGMYRLNTGGSRWLPENNGLEDLNILSLTVVGPGQYYLGTSLQGIYTSIQARSSVRTKKDNFAGIVLQVYPNPSTGPLTLKVAGATTDIDISLIAINGTTVQHIYNGAPHDAITASADNLAAGRYYIRLLHQGMQLTVPVEIITNQQ